MKSRKLAVSAIAMLATVGLVSACTPPDEGGGLPKVNWKFRGTQVQVQDSQDCTIVLGVGINCKDEPFLLNIGFQVKIGEAGSAQAWVVNHRSNSDVPQDVSSGTTIDIANNYPNAGAPVVFSNIQPVDLLDLANTNNKMTIVGTYTWALEQDTAGLGLAADSIASLLKQALNTTLASSSVAGLDAQAILNLVVSNIGNAMAIGLQNIGDIDFGLGDINDDALGGALYIGIGAHGALGGAIDGLLGNFTAPPINIPIVAVPPSIDAIGIYTMTGAKNFTQVFNGQDGQHQWWMTAGPA